MCKITILRLECFLKLQCVLQEYEVHFFFIVAKTIACSYIKRKLIGPTFCYYYQLPIHL